MSALAGTIDEWIQVEPGRWARYVRMPKSPWGARSWSEEDGIITLREGVMLADLWHRRANPPPEPADRRDAKIADLEARLAALETKARKSP